MLKLRFQNSDKNLLVNYCGKIILNFSVLLTAPTKKDLIQFKQRFGRAKTSFKFGSSNWIKVELKFFTGQRFFVAKVLSYWWN